MPNVRKIIKYIDGAFINESAELPEEALCRVVINGKNYLSTLCTPNELKPMIVGSLWLDCIIDSVDEIQTIHVDEDEYVVYIELANPPKEKKERIITSGFGVGSIAAEATDPQPVLKDLSLACSDLHALMKELVEMGSLYRRSGGTHTTALYRGNSFIVCAEDIGRHNTFDKAVGKLILQGVDTAGAAVLTTGRISSEMVLKCGRMGAPLIASLSAATSGAAETAERLGICTVGYVKSTSLNIYSAPHRLNG